MPRAPPMIKTKLYTKTNKGDHSQLGSINFELLLKFNHPPKHNPKYLQLMYEKNERKEKIKWREVGTIIPS